MKAARTTLSSDRGSEQMSFSSGVQNAGLPRLWALQPHCRPRPAWGQAQSIQWSSGKPHSRCQTDSKMVSLESLLSDTRYEFQVCFCLSLSSWADFSKVADTPVADTDFSKTWNSQSSGLDLHSGGWPNISNFQDGPFLLYVSVPVFGSLLWRQCIYKRFVKDY